MFLLKSRKKSKYYYIKVLNSKIVFQREAEGYPYGPIRLTSHILNSKEALETARKYIDLKPGTEWAIGYHYLLTQPKDFPIITVYGYSPEGNLSFVEINAENREIISSKTKKYDENGNGSWVNY